MTGTLFAIVVTFAPDSPLALGSWSPPLGVVAVATFSFFVNWYDRLHHRRRLARSPHAFHNSKSMERLDQISGCIDDLARISDALTGLDDYWLPSNVNKLLKRREVLRLERLVIQTLQALPATELNYALKHTKLGLLFYKVKDHRGGLFGIELPGDLGESLGAERYHHRTQLVELLAVQRVTDLSIRSRGLVIDALQQMPLSAHGRAEDWVRNVFAWTKGDELSQLKTMCDLKGDFQSLHKLVFLDIKARSRRRGARGRERERVSRARARARARALSRSRALSQLARKEKKRKTRAP